MNKSPINYLATIAIGGILWVITAIFYAGAFTDSLVLSTLTPESFLANIRVVFGIGAALGIVLTLYWYYYGELTSTAGNLSKAKRVWWTCLILLIISAIAIVFTLIIMNLSEGLLTLDWLIIFGLTSLHTWVFFWFCTFLMSPRTVKFIPLFKR